MSIPFHTYDWNSDEEDFLAHYVTNTNLPVFALKNLPEAVKGALFARYSRTHKDLRRLLLDEFAEDLDPVSDVGSQGLDATDTRASRLYDTVLDGFGDDSVAQLGSAHIACEQVSNILTKILERGRLMSYLEQSTRYIPYDSQIDGQWRYRMPPDLPPSTQAAFNVVIGKIFEAYAETSAVVLAYLRNHADAPEDVSAKAWDRKLKAQTLDAARGILPAATVSNLGIHGSGQAFEHLLLRLLGHPLQEAQDYGVMMLVELRKVIPEFLRRVDKKGYGTAAIRYRQERAAALAEAAAQIKGMGQDPVTDQNAAVLGPQVLLMDYDKYGEKRVLAAALTPHLHYSEATVRDALARQEPETIEKLFKVMMGDRTNRRHRPGRELEALNYRFEIIGDYGSYRDLQRHRMLTIEAQPLNTQFGYDTPNLIKESGASELWEQAMWDSHILHMMLGNESPEHAPYAVSMAYRMRYMMSFNAREAMHMIELRSQPSGHPSYRWIVQEMLRQIRDVAEHRLIASLFSFADMTDGETGRLDAEQRTEQRSAQQD